jgi:hypothetical protein
VALYPLLWKEKGASAMNIEITRPEVEALIYQRLRASGFDSTEEVIFRALQEFQPKKTNATGKRTFADVCARMRGLAEDLDLTRDPSPGRDVVL